MSRFGGIGALLVATVTSVVVAGCASHSGTRSSGPEQGATISDVRVDSTPEATVVTLVGLDHPVFTAFAQDDPQRVVIDLGAVDVTGLTGSVPVHDGVVEDITVSPFTTGLADPLARVEIALTTAATYEITATLEGLEIRLESAAALASAPESQTPAWGMDDDPWASLETPSEPAPMPALSATATPATTLRSVEARQAGGASLVHLVADGMIERVESFTLTGPDRLVVDLPGLSNEVAAARIDVDSSHASRVRVGEHADKIRIVIDAGSAPDAFSERQVTPVDDGLMIALGSDPEVARMISDASQTAEAAPSANEDAWSIEPTPSLADEAWPAASAEPMDSGSAWDSGPASDEMAETASDPMAGPAAEEMASEANPAPEMAQAPATETAPANVYGVEFASDEGRDRLIVLGDRPLDYLVHEPDAETLIVSIEGAVIEPEAAARITPDAGGPVSLITVFQQPDVAEPEVRVVMRRAAGVSPEIARSGSMLVMDVTRGGPAAEAPPMLASHDSTESKSSLPASIAPAGAAVSSAGPGTAAPASMEPQSAIGILQEGGLFSGKQYRGKRLSLDFKDVDIADVIRVIGDVTDLNVIAGDEVKGKVTIRLVDVPWDQALDVVLHTKGLSFQQMGNVLRIASADMLKSEEELRLQEKRAKEKLEDLIVKMHPVNYADVGDVEGLVMRLLSPRGTVNVDSRTNTLIMKDIPSVIEEATALIRAVDTQTPQVMIEAKIVEASLDFSREFGSVWSFGAQPLTDGFVPGSAPRQDLGNSFFTFKDDNSFVSGNPITAGPTALANLGAFILDEKLNLELQLQAAEVSGDGKVISSPRIVTLDNSEAKIEQGISIPFQTFENGDAQLEFVDAVLSLNVTPHITADSSIIMEIEVTRNAPDDSVFTLTGSPAIAKNQVDTETLVKDGQTLVIGGIYVIDKSQRQSRVPYLHRIPILGAAFRSDEFSDSRKELLIFVTPRIVVNPEAAS